MIRLLPQILTARTLIPSEQTLRAVVFNDLKEAEADELVGKIVPDSGRAFRSLIMGTIRVPKGAVTCPVLCVSGGQDRNVSPRISRALAARYGAEHHIHPDRRHWIVANSAIEEVAPPVLKWLRGVLPASSPACATAGREGGNRAA